MVGAWWAWLIAIAMYALFRLWYDNWRGPLSRQEIETFMTVLIEFGAFPDVIEAELTKYLPFLATTKILMAAVKAGVGREVAHEVIK